MLILSHGITRHASVVRAIHAGARRRRPRSCSRRHSSGSSGAGFARRFLDSSSALSAARSPCSESRRSSPRSCAFENTASGRYGALAAALGCAVWFSLREATGNPDVDVVQRFHFVEYGVITFLFYRAWRPLEDPAIARSADPCRPAGRNGRRVAAVVHSQPRRRDRRHPAERRSRSAADSCSVSVPIHRISFSGRCSPGSLSRVGRLGAVTILALALFFHVVHLGYDIRDHEVGIFKSRYSTSELAGAGGGQAGGMASPPVAAGPAACLPRRSVHDRRSDARAAAKRAARGERRDGAWTENLILEKYYAPVLDTPSYVSRTGHRWSPEQRASVRVPRRRAATRPTSALRIRIRFTRGRGVSSGSPRCRSCGCLIAAALSNDRSSRPRQLAIAGRLCASAVILGSAVASAARLLAAVMHLVP